MSLKEKWNKLIHATGEEQETEFLPAVLEVTETPPSPIGRLGMWTIVALITIGIIWSVVGKINEVAVATGKIVPLGQVKTIQSKNKGIVKAIYAKEGDYVKAGDVLVELDPTSTSADLDSLKKRAAYFRLDIERLNAELSGEAFLTKASEDLDEKDLRAQVALYQSRTAQHRAERQAAEMAVLQKRAALQSETINADKYNEMLAIAQDKENRLVNLVRENAIAEFQLLEQRSNRIELTKAAEGQQELIQKARAELAETQERLTNVDAAYHKDIMTNLVDARKQYYAYEEEIKKADENSRLSKIVAPVDGRVHQLAVNTVGGIVTDAQTLMMIVPEDVKLELEVWADNKDIGFIRQGQLAEVKIETFNFQKFGVIHALVNEISADALNDNRDQEKNKKYRLGLTFDQSDMNVSGKRVPLTPGMAVTAEIKIKEKRIIDFFLDPFRQYTSEALRER